MILVGQPELLEKLRRPELVQFAQRISVSYHLSPLSYSETKGYIRHRLYVAQADPALFTEAAIKAVYHFTNGVPRLINSVCDMACVYGYADGLPEIDVDTIRAVILDKRQSGLLPLYNIGGRLDREELEKAIEASVSASSGRGRADDDYWTAEHAKVDWDDVAQTHRRSRRIGAMHVAQSAFGPSALGGRSATGHQSGERRNAAAAWLGLRM